MEHEDKNQGGLMPPEPQDLDAVITHYEAPLLRYAGRLLNDPSAAQDVVQAVFLKLCKHWKNGARPSAQLKGWLYRVTHNQAVDHIRRESRIRVLHERHAEERAGDVDEAGHPQLDRSEALQLALRFLPKLPEAERQVLLLRLQQGLSYKEIAEVTRRSEGNVGCLLHHAAHHLSEHLKRAGAI